MTDKIINIVGKTVAVVIAILAISLFHAIATGATNASFVGF